MANDVIAGRYRLRELLGSGPMSEVWAADDAELERRVALKLLAPDADRARFEREARAAAALAHPNITQLYDFGEAEGRPFMVLEYLPGGTLEERLAGGRPLADGETQRVAAEVAAGLAHAHSRGLVHRDLKPANILFDAEGRAKIADFGIARLGGGGTLTEAGTVLGTAAYIAPEQAVGEQATPASDVYSFGIILYRLLSGRLPFRAEQPMELLKLHRDAPPPPLAEVRPDVPAALAALAEAALAKNPADRPRDGAALLAVLAPVPSGTGTAPTVIAAAADESAAAAASTAQFQAAPAPPRRRFPTAAIAGVVLLLAAGGAALAYAVTRPSGSATPTATFPTTVGHRTLPKLKTTASTHTATPVAPSTTEPTTTRTHTTRPATTASPPPTTAPPLTTAPPATTAPPLTTQPTTTDLGTGTTATVGGDY